ncbi:unnamed protein product [Lathyrus oleraceus]|uniref:MAPK kinase substrate protein n=1 Tax=Pisum sativum TaxID=3888 RepID=A0A9D4X3G3_PEA|nr:uncharacterized protein At1g15400 [Pisum sativum]KAI5414088.1 hypothetical protein KIW84_058289 [Pisum sativum]
MEGLQRSAVSFRRQGSSGFVWDDRFLQEEINKMNQSQQNNNQEQEKDEIKEMMNRDEPPQLGSINTVQRSRSNGGGGRGYRTGKVSPAIEPPSPRISVCGFCGAFGKVGEKTKPPKHRSR